MRISGLRIQPDRASLNNTFGIVTAATPKMAKSRFGHKRPAAKIRFRVLRL
jgi:hypothetical protein